VGDDPQAVKANLQRIYDSFGLESERVATVWQVHSADVLVLKQPPQYTDFTEKPNEPRWLARADGIVTNCPDVPLSMRFADCTPILFYDPKQAAIGIAHAGWRGTVSHAAANTLQALCDAFGSNPADVWVGIGPSIGPDRYQVGPEVVAAAEAAFGETAGVIRSDEAGSTYFDLWAANRLDLLRAGARPEHIAIAGLCTASHTDAFFSHRAENGQTGRFGAILALKGRA
jgi:polyphenol oxidase